MRNQRVLVTGGAGFIGSNLANYLAADNEVVAVDDCSIGTPENLEEDVEVVDASVLDEDLPTDVDVVFHLAAISTLTLHEGSTEDRRNGARVNVEGFVNVADQARQDGCETVVYASTSSIYGNRTEPSPESMAVEANTAYEASKLARERYAEYFANWHDMNVAGLRFFSVYQGYGGAEGHKGDFANIIAQFADWIASGQSPEIYGDGTHSRDFTHVSDIVRGIEAAADEELTGIYNLGTGQQYTATEVVERINDVLGTDVEPSYVENPHQVFVEHTLADATKMTEATGWEPEIGFQEGIEMVCAPYLEDSQ
jgi:UDP-glucose 4-epimerase